MSGGGFRCSWRGDVPAREERGDAETRDTPREVFSLRDKPPVARRPEALPRRRPFSSPGTFGMLAREIAVGSERIPSFIQRGRWNGMARVLGLFVCPDLGYYASAGAGGAGRGAEM
ncbi:hypothetical protein AAFF_G00323980 [Aldrovandia affinis]|uniref:Uncharacterized protein n=1 Tax=Aldrovandia affinis TaxID=143900 RepID=A0AAD7R6M6_9TELE|nr:hypothetical protein AAFF_G00323980 [Aldrovandia affinis]